MLPSKLSALLLPLRALIGAMEQRDRLPQIEVAVGDTIQFGRLVISHHSREVKLADAPVDLTTAEFDLLWLLATNAGRVLPRNEILKSLRGLDYDGIDRSIDSRVSRLRRKLGDDVSAAGHIKTVRPHGYLFSPNPW